METTLSNHETNLSRVFFRTYLKFIKNSSVFPSGYYLSIEEMRRYGMEEFFTGSDNYILLSSGENFDKNKFRDYSLKFQNKDPIFMHVYKTFLTESAKKVFLTLRE